MRSTNSSRPIIFSPIVLLVVAIFILAFSAWLYTGGNFSALADRSAPQVVIMRSGGDSLTSDLKLSANDVSGITALRITARQGNEAEVEIAKETFNPSLPSLEKLLTINPKALGFAEGEINLKAEITDSGFFHNVGAATLQLLVDYSPPTIALLSRQFTANQGGAEFLLYRVGGGAYTRTGVQIGDFFFRGLPGSAFDNRLTDHSDIHGVLIALPLGFAEQQTPINLFVEDAAGNKAQTIVQIPIKPLKQVDVNSKLTLSFLQRKLPEMIASYEARNAKAVSQQRVDQSDMSPAAQTTRFKLINETYRRALQQEMFKLIDNSAPTKLWSGTFTRPIPGSTTSLFGERRTYGLDGLAAGGSLHEGLDLASVQSDAVRAANAGNVVFAGELGIYGNTIMIDHGTGLLSLYGHLSSTAVAVDSAVIQNQEIGRTGSTGLAGGDHLHFEFRVGHVSVNPIEWWDPKWIADNIDGKVLEFLSRP